MSSLVAIIPKTVEGTDASVLSLPHPKNGQKCLVYFSQGQFLELLSTKEKHVSWFVGDSVIGGEPLTIATKIDPVFLVLPYLMRKPHHFAPLDQTLVDEKFPCAVHLSETDVSAVAEVKDERLGIVRFNKEKTLAWLEGKVGRVVKAMKASGIEPGFNSHLTEKEYERYAVGIVSDYISPILSSDLHDRMGIELASVEDEQHQAKRQKLSEEPVKGGKGATKEAKAKAPKMTKSQRELASVNTKGMKSMASFFKKK